MFHSIFSTLDLHVGSRKIQKYYFLSIVLREHLEWRGATRSSTQSASFSKNDQNTSVTLGLTEGQTRSKATQNNIFHGFTSNSSFSEIFNNFDQVWASLTRSQSYAGPKNPNFDPAVKTGWD